MNEYEPRHSIYKIDVNLDKVLRKYIYTEDAGYFVLNNYRKYIHKYFSAEEQDLSMYRSVVVSNPENKILCFSSPKSMIFPNFIRLYANYPIEKMIINDIIEGVMINLFYDPRLSKWEIATKSGVTGKYQFHNTKTKRKTFRRMFLDIFRCGKDEDIKDIAYLENLPKNYCYSFVMQHKENPIISPVEISKLYLVAIYAIEDDNRAIYIPATVYEDWCMFKSIRGIVDFPKRHTIKDYYEIKEKMGSIHNDASFMGVMITNNSTGERAAIYNKTYVDFKDSIKNDPQTQYQYLCICRTNKINSFIAYFPWHKKHIHDFYAIYNDLITNVHKSYVDHYIKKSGTEISLKYWPHIYKLHHEIYLPSLSVSHNIVIKRPIVKYYFDKMEPRELLYHLYYDRRTIQQ
jgi:hypothetical protein